MNEIYDALFSPVWWFTAIVAGTIASMLGTVWMRRVDNFSLQRSKRWQERTAQEKNDFEALVQELRSGITYQYFAALNEIKYLVLGLFGFLLSLVSLALSEILYKFRHANLLDAYSDASNLRLLSSAIIEVAFLVISFLCFFFITHPCVVKSLTFKEALKEARKLQTLTKEQTQPENLS